MFSTALCGRAHPHRSCTVVLIALVLALVGCSQAPSSGGGATFTPAASSVEDAADALTTEVVVDGLDHPWDLAVLPDGSLLVTERPGRLVRIVDSTAREVSAPLDDVFAESETGLMGLVLDPDFADNRRFYTCQGNAPAHDIRVIAWTLSSDMASATRVGDPLVRGLALSSGRHGGCRLAFDTTGALLVSAGDAAQGKNPQDLTVLGGKVLRINPRDGSAPADNPYASSTNAKTRLVFTLGHRNVQGLAVRPGTGKVYATEHGPSIDDEINILASGGNYGWNPVGSGEYDESVPMTDTGIKGAISAAWSSGSSTIAVSGATFLSGERWGPLDGMLAVASLKGSHVDLFELDEAGAITSSVRPPALDSFGRLRTIVQATDGTAYVLTDNGSNDSVVKVTAA